MASSRANVTASFRARFRAAAACLVIALVVLAGAAPAPAEPEFGNRYALVIGNSNYAHVESLPNTGRDAEAIAEALESLRFTVFKGIDLTGDEFERLIGDFDAAAAAADTVVFYYAGHGFQLDGLNHLAPVDAVLRDRSSIDSETLVLDDIIARLHRRQRQTIVFLDACRNNPLPPAVQATGERGLAQVGTGDDTFIAFATQPGNVSYDGSAKNSPFTEALLTHIGTPSRSISSLMIEVRNDVSDRTVGRQVPWDQSSLRADFQFNPTPQYIAMSGPADGGIVIGRQNGKLVLGRNDAETAAEPRTAPAAPAAPAPISIGPALEQAPVAAKPEPETVIAAVTARPAPDRIRPNVRSIPTARAQPETPAAANIAREPDMALAAATVSEQPDSVAAAANFAPIERLKPAREWFPDEASEEPEAGERQMAALDPQQPDSDTAAAHFAPIERLKPAREWFPDEVAEEPEAGEGQIAALDPRQMLAPETGLPAGEPLIDRHLARSIQGDLARIGCYRLSVDGVWGPGSRTGLERYYREKGESPSSLEPSTDVLAMLQDESGTVCTPAKASAPAKTSPPRKPRVAAPEQKKVPATAKARQQRPAAVAPPPRQPAAAAKSPKILGF